MRGFASCFSEHAVKVSDSTCSVSRSGVKLSAVAALDTPSAIASLYRTKLSNNKDLLVKLTWSKTHLGPVLSLGVDVNPYGNNWNPDAIRSQLLRGKKGRLSYDSCPSYPIGFHWDYSAAKFNSGPEPVSNFFVVIMIRSECALLLGDLSRDYMKKRFERTMINFSEFSLVGRKEQVVGLAVYLTKARFSAQGMDHDLAISCKWDGLHREGELVVVVDRKRVMEVNNLVWKFRGNATISVDGWPVDVMWDLKEFGSPQGCATFMFRRRNDRDPESSLWCDEEMIHRERGLCGFSLWIQAFKCQRS